MPLGHEDAIVVQVRFFYLVLQLLASAVEGVAIVQPQRSDIVGHAESVDGDVLSLLSHVRPIEVDGVRHLVHPELAATMDRLRDSYLSCLSMASPIVLRLQTDRGICTGFESTPHQPLSASLPLYTPLLIRMASPCRTSFDTFFDITM